MLVHTHLHVLHVVPKSPNQHILLTQEIQYYSTDIVGTKVVWKTILICMMTHL